MFKLQTQSSAELSKALNIASKCMSKKTTLAILDYILLSKEGDHLTFTTSTLDAQLTLPAPLTVVVGTMDKSLCLPVADIMAYVSALPDCVVTFTFNDNHTLDIDYCLAKGEQTKSGNASLSYLDSTDFPHMEGCTTPTSHLVLPGTYFTQTIKQLRNFAANDELRPQMNGAYIDIASDSTCNLVASDGQKLIRCSYNEKGDPVQPSGFILSSIFFSPISAFENSDTVTLDADAQTIRIYDDEKELICRTLEGKYPNYAAVIPSNNPYFIIFDKKEMIDSIKRVSLFGNTNTQLVKLEMNGNFIQLSAQDMDFATKSQEQVCILSAECQEGFVIGLNATLLLNALNAIVEDNVKIQMSDMARPVLLTSDNPSPNVLALCMPMLLDI